MWWSPDPRAILLPGELRINRSLHRALKRREFNFSYNRDFAGVIKNCARPRAGESGTWITDRMHEAYLDLHRLALAHSFECWHKNKLVGGMYGVWIGNVFFAESMFRKADNASKLVLVYAVNFLRQRQVKLIDIQIISQHLQSLGAVEISRREYLQLLKSNI